MLWAGRMALAMPQPTAGATTSSPTYDAFFPEYYLNAIQTEHLIRDLSPFTTSLYGTPHGRFTAPPGGQPPTMWITEWNLDPAGADPSNPANLGGAPLPNLTDSDIEHMHAKSALRYLTSVVSKGVSAVHLFAAKHGSLALVDPISSPRCVTAVVATQATSAVARR